MEVDSRVLVSFARDLEALVGDFREEMEIMSSKSLMRQIEKTRRAKKKGELLRFESVEDFLGEVRAKRASTRYRSRRMYSNPSRE